MLYTIISLDDVMMDYNVNDEKHDFDISSTNPFDYLDMTQYRVSKIGGENIGSIKCDIYGNCPSDSICFTNE